MYRLIIKITNYSYLIKEIVQLPFKWYITINGQSIKTDVVDRPKTCSGLNVICHMGGTYGNKSVNIKFIYILSVNIFFLFQETPVNKNIQVIEASGRGYIVGILIQLTISGFA